MPNPNDWRSTDAGKSGGGGRSWQTSDTQPADGAAPVSRRAIKRTIAVLALLALAVAIGVLIILPRAQRPACLIVVGSGYEQNLFLPHNVYGWNGGTQLLKDNDIAESEAYGDKVRYLWSQPTLMRRIESPFELKDASWQETWDKIAKEIGKGSPQENVVIFMSMHGYANANEAYLLRNVPDVQTPDGFKASRIAFGDVLKSLKDVKDKNIVLLLDVCHVQSHWPIGMLHNDFAERLKGYEKEIDALGNVTVICSAGPKERSWDNEEEQASAFAYFVAQCLKGAGQREQERITGMKLYEFVKDNVNKWTSVNRARRQTPFILGTKAADVELVRVVKPYQKQDAKPRPFASADAAALTTAWGTWKRLKRDQAPQVHSPHYWRLYQDTLLRYEQLVRAGDPTGNASALKQKLDGLAADIEKARGLDEAFAALGNDFPIHRVLGYRPKEVIPDAALDEYLTLLKDGKLDEKDKALARFLSQSRDDRRLWQTQLSRRLLTENPDKPGFDRPSKRKLLVQVAKDLDVPQRAAEVHLVKLLDNLDAGFDKLDDKAELVRLAVRVRMLAEEAALSVPAENEAGELYAETIFTRIREDIKEADAKRLEAEDALFAEPSEKQLAKARTRFNAAQERYQEASANAQKVRRALALRDEVSADLPFIASALPTLPGINQQAIADIDVMRIAAESLGNGLADMTSDLAKPELPRDVSRSAKSLSELRTNWQKVCTSLATQEGELLQKNWHAMDGVLSIPPMDKTGDVDQRMRLMSKLRELSGALSTRPLTDKQPDEAEEDSVERQRTLLHAWLKAWRGANPAGEKNADAVDGGVREFFLKLPDEIKNVDMKDEKKLASASSGCRVMPGALADHVRDKQSKRINPLDRLRRMRACDLLVWLGERTIEDHWFEPDPKGDKLEDATYYVPVAKAYRDAAAGLAKERVTGRDPAQAGLTFANTPNRYWTTEPALPLAWQVGVEDSVPAGTPVVWLEILDGSKKAHPWRVKPREQVVPWPAAKPFEAAFELKKLDFIESTDVKLAFHAVYRGQHLIEKLTLQCPPPEVIVRHTPGPEKVGFAVRMDSDFDYGAVSLVLDNSGSMNYKHPFKMGADGPELGTKGKDRRFDFALKALKHVLDRVPDKTQLSIFKLGDEVKAQQNPNGKQEVTRVEVPPGWWQERGTLLSRLEGIPGNLASPIAEGIVTAMNRGFPDGHKGPKIIIALTDGDDNLSFGSTHNGKNQQQIDRHTQKVVNELEEAYKMHKDVHVIVVCFIQEDDPEYQRAADQFSIVEQFRPNRGRFKRVTDPRDLGVTIEELMRPHVQLKRRPDGMIPAGFESGRPVNYYHSDRTLDWGKGVSAGNYDAAMLGFPGQNVGVEMPRGNNIFALLKRKNNDLFLERGLLANQPEIKGSYPTEKDTPDRWLVTLLENHRALAGNSITQTVLFERKEAEKDLRQTHPAFTWLELDPLAGRRPDETLQWRNDWTMPAPALQLKTPWPADQGTKLTAWFSPDELPKLYENTKYVKHRRVQIPHVPEGPNDPVESIRTERRMIGGVEKDWLAVRLRYAERKPIFVLLRDYPQANAEHRHFLSAGKCTAYFNDLPPALTELNLVLIDVEAFKSTGATSRVAFTPDRELALPAIFRFEARD